LTWAISGVKVCFRFTPCFAAHAENFQIQRPGRPVERHIHIIRGQKVMLDSELAALYRFQTFRLNEAVKRNRARFPEDFMFQLSREEAKALTSQTAISKVGSGGRRTPPYVFTEHGVAMLSSVLRSERAVQMNITIIRAFVHLREMIAANKDLAERIGKLETGRRQTDSIISVLVGEIDGIAREVRHMKALPASPGRKIGFDL
jgi:ORF6N domain